MRAALNSVRIVKQSEKDYFDTLSNLDLMKLKSRYLGKKDYLRASYLSRLLIVRNSHVEVHQTPATVSFEEIMYV